MNSYVAGPTNTCLNIVAPPRSQAVNGENKHQPKHWEKPAYSTQANQMLSKGKSMKKLIMILALLFAATTAFALPGDPPLSCDPEAKLYLKSPDFPFPISYVHKVIREQAIKMLDAKLTPYLENDPQTGEKFYRKMYQPQADAALREVEEWRRRAKDKAEKYVENDPCPDGLGLIIRQKYLDLIW
jgi:hypothetical protein